MKMNGVTIRSVEELKRNFAINDLVDEYFSGALEFFLEDIGDTEGYRKIRNIDKNNAYLLIRLYEILGIPTELSEEEVRKIS